MAGLSLCAGVICVGLSILEAVAGITCFQCSSQEPPRDDTWLQLAGIAALVCAIVLVLAIAVAVIARPRPPSPRSELRKRRMKVVGWATRCAFACLVAGTVLDLEDLTGIVFELGLYASVVVAIAAAIAAIVVRTPPPVPPAKVVS